MTSISPSLRTTTQGTVLVRVTGQRESVTLVVVDDGEGVDPADSHRLTERFARGPSGAGQSRRFGLGLALVDEVVRAHRGTLSLSGAMGRGATATMVLPRSAED